MNADKCICLCRICHFCTLYVVNVDIVLCAHHDYFIASRHQLFLYFFRHLQIQLIFTKSACFSRCPGCYLCFFRRRARAVWLQRTVSAQLMSGIDCHHFLSFFCRRLRHSSGHHYSARRSKCIMCLLFFCRYNENERKGKK